MARYHDAVIFGWRIPCRRSLRTGSRPSRMSVNDGGHFRVKAHVSMDHPFGTGKDPESALPDVLRRVRDLVAAREASQRRFDKSFGRIAIAMSRMADALSAQERQVGLLDSLKASFDQISSAVSSIAADRDSADAMSRIADALSVQERQVGLLDSLKASFDQISSAVSSIAADRDSADVQHTEILALLLDGQNELRSEMAEIRYWVSRTALKAGVAQDPVQMLEGERSDLSSKEPGGSAREEAVLEDKARPIDRNGAWPSKAVTPRSPRQSDIG